MSDTTDRGAILHGEVRIEYTVVRSRRRRRTIGIILDRSPSAAGRQETEDRVVVRAPWRASRAVVEDVVRRKAGWILGVTQRRRDAEGDGSHRFALRDTEGRVIGVEGYESYRERAQVVLEAAVERWAPVVATQRRGGAEGDGSHRFTLRDTEGRVIGTEEGGRPYGRVLVRNQKRIWGSCARDGTLRFNWRLVMLERSLIDYVVVHELVHLRVRNHAREFWSAVAEVLPDFRERRARLREARLL